MPNGMVCVDSELVAIGLDANVARRSSNMVCNAHKSLVERGNKVDGAQQRSNPEHWGIIGRLWYGKSKSKAYVERELPKWGQEVIVRPVTLSELVIYHSQQEVKTFYIKLFYATIVSHTSRI